MVGKPFVPTTGVPSATALLGFLEGGGAVELQNSMRGMGGPHTHRQWWHVVARMGHSGLKTNHDEALEVRALAFCLQPAPAFYVLQFSCYEALAGTAYAKFGGARPSLWCYGEGMCIARKR